MNRRVIYNLFIFSFAFWLIALFYSRFAAIIMFFWFFLFIFFSLMGEVRKVVLSFDVKGPE